MTPDPSHPPTTPGPTARRRRWCAAAAPGRPGAAAELDTAHDDLGLADRPLGTRVGVPFATLQGWMSGRDV